MCEKAPFKGTVSFLGWLRRVNAALLYKHLQFCGLKLGDLLMRQRGGAGECGQGGWKLRAQVGRQLEPHVCPDRAL